LADSEENELIYILFHINNKPNNLCDSVPVMYWKFVFLGLKQEEEWFIYSLFWF